jgi:hypothetical protein
MSDNRYIIPITEVSSSFREAKEQYNKFGHFVFYDAKPTPIGSLAQGRRTVVVGEPGIGKTELVKKMENHLKHDGHTTSFIPLSSRTAINEIDKFVGKSSKKTKSLFLDALDEVPRSEFNSVLKKIQEISEKYPKINIYISSRWVFMDKYASSFPTYRFIIIKPFTPGQISEYLEKGGLSEGEVEDLLNRSLRFHGQSIIQIPRYLFLFEDFVKAKGVTNISNFSRNDLFEHFIYSKLSLESGRNEQIRDLEPVIKRLLEKLALTMEIYQSNNITRDELVTFFDEICSDLKLMVLAQVGIDILLENTVLQTSKYDTGKIEFENVEFQEYLAAKEITRLAEPRKAIFEFATDPVMKEIYPAWYNTLSFYTDMDTEMLGQLIDFSGISGTAFKIVDESFINFLGRINPSLTPLEVKKRLFKDVINYHNNRLQWIPGQLTSALPAFFSSDLEKFLKQIVEKAETEQKDSTKYYVPLGNVSYILAYLLKSKVSIDKEYWREKLISYSSDAYENGVLPRHALYALAEFGDKTIVNDLPDITDTPDELVMREYVSLCTSLDPNSDRSINAFVKLIRANDLHGRYGIYEITEPQAIKKFLQIYIEDEQFRKEFLDDTSIFKDKDLKIVDHIKDGFDDEMQDLLFQAIVKSVHYSVSSTRGKSTFVRGIMKLLRDKNDDFFVVLINQLNSDEEGAHGLYFAQDFFEDLLRVEDVATFIDAMLAADEQQNVVMHTLTRIKLKGGQDAELIYEAGRSKLPTLYQEYEEARSQQQVNHDDANDDRILEAFKTSLCPAENMYMNRVFYDYNSNAEKLEKLMSSDDKYRFDTLIIQEALRHDPSSHGLTINSETDDGASRNYTASGAAIIFGDALKSAQLRKIEITPYRSNIAKFIPFAHTEQLQTVFELIPDFTEEELDPVVEIYSSRDNDLWKWQPDAFVDSVEQYSLTKALPILKDFIHQSDFRSRDRIKALNVSETLHSDENYLMSVFGMYKESTQEDEREIAIAANSLLITKHANRDAVNWRLDQVKSRVAATPTRRRSRFAHTVTPMEDEIRFGKEFAKPLMDLKYQGFEDEYLLLLDRALEVWAMGENHRSYAQYLWEITFAYFENLKEFGDYKPLKILEEKIAAIGTKKKGANWLAGHIVKLRLAYLNAIGKPIRYAEAIRRYNAARKYVDSRITTSADLTRELQDVFDSDLRKWIEGEGAYELILGGRVLDSKKQEYEKLIQKTITTQIENALLKRGIESEVLREPDLLDDKRVDLIIRYGFVGPVIVEIKLTSNKDIRGRKVEESKSYKSLQRYMDGYGASHGIFLIIVNEELKTLDTVKYTFMKIDGVSAISLDCTKYIPATSTNKSKEAVAKKTAVKKVVKGTVRKAKK